MTFYHRYTFRHPLAASLILLAGCRNLVDPPLPGGAQRYSPPAVYATWWAMTEHCAGIFASMNRILWFDVPGVSTLQSDIPDVQGYWSAASNRIVLAGNAAMDGSTVRHEMLHALLQRGTHPRNAFLDRCGGVVGCSKSCLADGGPPPPDELGTLEVRPDDLEIRSRIEPASPSATVNDGFFAVIVTVTNAMDVPVTAVLPPRAGPSTTFSYRLLGPYGGVGGGELELDSSVVRFKPHETKQQIFDFRIGVDSAAGQLRPGVYTIAVAFGAHWVYQSAALQP